MASAREVEPSTVTPGVLRTWAAILLLTDNDATRRPVTAISEALGIDKSIVSRNLDRLTALGIVRRNGSKIASAFCPVTAEIQAIDFPPKAPGSGPISRGDFRGGVDRFVDRNWWGDTVNKIAASLENCAIFSTAFKQGDLRIYTHPEKGAGTTMKKQGGVAAAIQQVATIVVGRDRPGPRAGKDPLDDFLVEAYTARRRKTDPMFEVRPRDKVNLRRARTALEFRLIRSGTWGRYLDWIFDWFPKIADCPFPPTSVVASENLIDRFQASLGERRLDVNKAERMLAAAGFDDVRAATVCSIARTVAASGRRGKIDPPRVGEAVDWLVPRLREVGYRDEER